MSLILSSLLVVVGFVFGVLFGRKNKALVESALVVTKEQLAAAQVRAENLARELEAKLAEKPVSKKSKK